MRHCFIHINYIVNNSNKTQTYINNPKMNWDCYYANKSADLNRMNCKFY